MTESSLKSQATKGMLWNAAEKFAVQGGQLFIGIILARILVPDDFGLIGMLTIFIAISQVFVESGMGSGLVQKKERIDSDFSTVFVFNFVISLLIYLILFFFAPLIAKFYNMPQLVILTRVLTINIIINSLAVVQRTRLTINLDFKTIAKVNVVSVFVGGILGVLFAYWGYGVWSLVIQNLSGAIASVIMFWFLSHWRPSFLFSKKSFNELFGFGYKLLLSGLYAQIINNLYNLIIGKVFSAAELGYYTRARSFAELTAGTVTSVLHQVSFPILASLRDDKDRMTVIFSKMIRMTSFFIFPSMTILAILAKPFVIIVLTEKWLPVVPFLQMLCFARVFYSMSVINMNILNAIGRSDLFLKVDLLKFPLYVISLIITIPLGLNAIVIGQMFVSFFAFLMNSYLSGRLFGYGSIAQLKDMMPVFVASIIAAFVVWFFCIMIESMLLKLILGIIIGGTVYLLASYFLKINELKEIQLLARNFVK